MIRDRRRHSNGQMPPSGHALGTEQARPRGDRRSGGDSRGRSTLTGDHLYTTELGIVGRRSRSGEVVGLRKLGVSPGPVANVRIALATSARGSSIAAVLAEVVRGKECEMIDGLRPRPR